MTLLKTLQFSNILLDSGGNLLQYFFINKNPTLKCFSFQNCQPHFIVRIGNINNHPPQNGNGVFLLVWGLRTGSIGRNHYLLVIFVKCVESIENSCSVVGLPAMNWISSIISTSTSRYLFHIIHSLIPDSPNHIVYKFFRRCVEDVYRATINICNLIAHCLMRWVFPRPTPP